MKRKTLAKIMLALFAVNAFTLASIHASGTAGNPEGWMRGEYDMARTRYFPYPSKYHIPDEPFEMLWTSPHEGKRLMAYTGDVNGDGKLEIVKVSGDNLRVISNDGTVLWTETIPGCDSHYGTGWLHLNMLEDVTGDGVPEIFVSRKVSDTLQDIYVYDGSQNRIKTLSGTVGYDGAMQSVAVFDVDNDGDKEIFCSMGTNYAGNPRGACLFDYDTGTRLWYYAAGNPIGNSIADLNNDGVLEITSSAWFTVHNGAWGRGKAGEATYTDDSSVYVVVVNENGDEILTKQIHDTHTHGYAYGKIVDLDRDGTKEIIVFRSTTPANPNYAEIFLWDSNGNCLKSYQGPWIGGWGKPVIADINKDGKDEVTVRDADGVLLVFDYNLNIIDSTTGYAAQFANDINGDGELEIICWIPGVAIGVLDNNLDELWRMSLTGTAIASDVTGDGVNDLIITNNDGLHVFSFPGIEATVDVDPNTLNLKSNGEWITAYIELPAGFDVANIDVGSIVLTADGGDFYVDVAAPTAIGDYDVDGVSDLMVKFNRAAVRDHLIKVDLESEDGPFYEVGFYITGNVDTITFFGTDTVRVRTP